MEGAATSEHWNLVDIPLTGDRRTFEIGADETPLFGSLGAFGGLYSATCITDKGIHLKRRGRKSEYVPYGEVVCVQYHDVPPHPGDLKRDEVYFFAEDGSRYQIGALLPHGKRMIRKDTADETAPRIPRLALLCLLFGVLGVFYLLWKASRFLGEVKEKLVFPTTLADVIHSHALRERRAAATPNGSHTTLENEILARTREQVRPAQRGIFKKREFASVDRTCCPLISEIVGSPLEKTIRGKLHSAEGYWEDPAFVFDEWIVGFGLGSPASTDKGVGVTLVKRSEVYFAYFIRRFKWVEHYHSGYSGRSGSSSGSTTYSREETDNELYLYTHSKIHVLPNVKYKAIAPLLGSLNPRVRAG